MRRALLLLVLVLAFTTPSLTAQEGVDMLARPPIRYEIAFPEVVTFEAAGLVVTDAVRRFRRDWLNPKGR